VDAAKRSAFKLVSECSATIPGWPISSSAPASSRPLQIARDGVPSLSNVVARSQSAASVSVRAAARRFHDDFGSGFGCDFVFRFAAASALRRPGRSAFCGFFAGLSPSYFSIAKASDRSTGSGAEGDGDPA